MKTIASLPVLRVSRNPVVALGIFAAVLFAAYYAAEAVLANDITGLAMFGLLFVAGAVVVAVLNDWHRGLYFFVGWLVFEDLARKYLGNNMAIYFGKDLLAIILYVSFFRAQRANPDVNAKLKLPFRIPLLLFIWLGIIQMFNPSSTSIFYGILGLKVNFLYLPLLYIGYSLVAEERELQRFLSFTSVLIIVVCGLGLAQSIIGPSFLNPSTLQDDIRDLSTLYRVSPITGLAAYRPTSVFVSTGRFGDFLLVAWVISLSYSGYLLLRSRRGRALAFTAIGVTAAATFMTASRGAFMWNAGISLVFVTAFFWGAPWRQREAIRVLRAVSRTSLIIFLVFLLLLYLFPKELGSRAAIYLETLMPDSPTSELAHRTQNYPLKQLGYAFDHPQWPYGYGIGTCTLGGQYVVRLMHAKPMGIGVESGLGNILVELGIVGLLLWILLGASIVVSGWIVVNSLKGTPWFPLAFGFWFYALLLFFPMEYSGIAPYQDFVLNSFLWLTVGILFHLRRYPGLVETQAKQQVEQNQWIAASQSEVHFFRKT